MVIRLWKPDLFFANEKHGYFHDVTQPNTMLRLYPSGEVLYSARYSLVLSCDMNLEKFPFDTQKCHMQMGSCTYFHIQDCATEDEARICEINFRVKLIRVRQTGG